MKQNIAGKDDNHINTDDHPLLMKYCKRNGTPSENGEGKFENLVTEITAEKYFNTGVKEKVNFKK